MTASLLQETADISSTNESSVTQAFAGACTPGSIIHAICIVANAGWAGVVGTPSDGTNAYTALDIVQGTTYALKHWYAPNASSSALSVVLPLGFTTTQHLWIIREIGGCSSTIDAHSASFSNAQVTGSNAQSVSATAANQPCFASAVGWYFGTGEAVGTTLAWSQGQLNLNPPVMGGRATTEHLRFTATGSKTATWTPAGSSGAAGLACIAIFDEFLSVTGGGLLLTGVG